MCSCAVEPALLLELVEGPDRLGQAAPVEAVVLEPALEVVAADTAVPGDMAGQGMLPGCWLDLW